MDNPPQQNTLTPTAQSILSQVTDLPIHPKKEFGNANFFKRVAAYLIDMTIILPFYFFFLFLLSTTPVPEDERITIIIFVGITMLLLLFISFGFFIYFEGRGGATPGKRAMKILVVKLDGSECGIRESTIRSILRIFDIILFPIIFLNPKRQRLGDKLAGTWVVKLKT